MEKAACYFFIIELFFINNILKSDYLQKMAGTKNCAKQVLSDEKITYVLEFVLRE